MSRHVTLTDIVRASTAPRFAARFTRALIRQVVRDSHDPLSARDVTLQAMRRIGDMRDVRTRDVQAVRAHLAALKRDGLVETDAARPACATDARCVWRAA